ncbi:MAG: Maf family protein [Silvibacterium sp.]
MLVLASASPRRRGLLTLAGFAFTVAPASINEDSRLGENPLAYVTRLALEKAQSIYAQLDSQDDSTLVLGADTTVVAPNGEVLGKPADAADAARMLRLLSGATHQVITGVAVVSAFGVETAAEVTLVSVLTLSDEEIAAYIATGEPMDKAGAYAIQGHAARWIPRIQGCYFNVVGLPLALVAGMLEGAGIRREQLVR